MATRREVLAEGRHLRFVRAGGWEYVERNTATGVAVVVALTPEGRLLLVEQFRAPVGGPVIELPAGLAGDTSGREAEPARRELLEETGYSAAKVAAMGAPGPPSAGVASEIVTFFHATGLRRQGPGGGEGDERIDVHEVALERVPAWLAERAGAGRLVDPKVYAGLYLLGRL